MSSPVVFDAAAFVSDLVEARCRVVLSWPATTFEPVEQPVTYFIAPGPAYTAVMERWHDAMEACPDHVEEVVAYLSGLDGPSS